MINAGYVVVYVAKEGQPDEFWVREAVDRGVDVIVSPDSDVVTLTQDTNIVVVKPPKGKADTALVTSIMARLENLRKVGPL